MTVRTLIRTIVVAAVVWCAVLFPEEAAAQCAISWSDTADIGTDMMTEALVEDYYGTECGSGTPWFYHEYSLSIQMSCGTQYQEVVEFTTVNGGGGTLRTSVSVKLIETTVCNINIYMSIWCSAIYQPIYEAWEAIQRDARPRPINFRDKIPGAGAGPGRLHFEYEWDSTSGIPANINDCLVGETVAYPNGNPFIWPNPPYGTSTSNLETINPWEFTVGGHLLQLEDNHLLPTQFRPAAVQVANSFTAIQKYRWWCPGVNNNVPVTFTDSEASQVIRREVFNDNGTWKYKVEKDGITSSNYTIP